MNTVSVLPVSPAILSIMNRPSLSTYTLSRTVKAIYKKGWKLLLTGTLLDYSILNELSLNPIKVYFLSILLEYLNYSTPKWDELFACFHSSKLGKKQTIYVSKLYIHFLFSFKSDINLWTNREAICESPCSRGRPSII